MQNPSTHEFYSVWTPRVQGVLRIITAFLFLQHGTAKYLNIPALGMQGIQPMSMVGVAGILEIVGGLLILVGLFTRPTAFILSGMMAVAYFVAHAPKALLSPLQNGGELAVLYCFIFLFFSVAGAGAFSIDGARNKH